MHRQYRIVIAWRERFIVATQEENARRSTFRVIFLAIFTSFSRHYRETKFANENFGNWWMPNPARWRNDSCEFHRHNCSLNSHECSARFSRTRPEIVMQSYISLVCKFSLQRNLRRRNGRRSDKRSHLQVKENGWQNLFFEKKGLHPRSRS